MLEPQALVKRVLRTGSGRGTGSNSSSVLRKVCSTPPSLVYQYFIMITGCTRLPRLELLAFASSAVINLYGRYLTRATVSIWGALLSAAISTLFLAYWFSAKEELQGLKEVYQT